MHIIDCKQCDGKGYEVFITHQCDIENCKSAYSKIKNFKNIKILINKIPILAKNINIFRTTYCCQQEGGRPQS